MTTNRQNCFDISLMASQIEEGFASIEQKLENLGDQAIEERVKLMWMKERMNLVILSIKEAHGYCHHV